MNATAERTAHTHEQYTSFVILRYLVNQAKHYMPPDNHALHQAEQWLEERQPSIEAALSKAGAP